MEARIYAEDPLKGFLPSVGHLLHYTEPQGVRVDSGVVEGDEIPVFYDPIISKVVAHGDTREIAINQLKAALEEYVIRGVGHNANFCRDVLSDKQFMKGTYTTAFIPQTYPEGFKNARLDEADLRNLAEISSFVFRTKNKLDSNQSVHYIVQLRD